MSIEEFLQELQKWLEGINNLDNTESIILNNKYFSF